MSKDISKNPEDNILKIFESVGVKVNKNKFKKLSAEEHIKEGISAVRRSLFNIVYSGMHFKAAQAKERGSINREAASLGVSRRTIYNAIDAYDVASRIPSEFVQALAQLDFTKLLILKRLDDVELVDFVQGNEVRGLTYDEAIGLSTREFEQRIKDAHVTNEQLENELASTKLRLHTANLHLQDLQSQKNDEPEIDYHPLIQKVRIEGAALTDHAFLDIDSIAALIDELERNANAISKDHPSQVEGALSTVWVNLNAIYAKVNQALNTFKNAFGDLSLEEHEISLMTEIEAKRMLDKREYMTSQHKAEKSMRQEQLDRAAQAKADKKAAKNKPGPKPGSKRKNK